MTNPFPHYKKFIIDQLAESQQTKDADVVLPPFFSNSPEMRRQALIDSYPLNQVIAASILNGNFDDKSARTGLLKHLDSADDNVANVVVQQRMHQPNVSEWIADIEQSCTLKNASIKAGPRRTVG